MVPTVLTLAISQSWTSMSCLPDAQSRAGHGMVINDQMAKLYILGGTRSKVEMNDFIEIDYITEVCQAKNWLLDK